jgi:hypothetical protein
MLRFHWLFVGAAALTGLALAAASASPLPAASDARDLQAAAGVVVPEQRDSQFADSKAAKSPDKSDTNLEDPFASPGSPKRDESARPRISDPFEDLKGRHGVNPFEEKEPGELRNSKSSPNNAASTTQDQIDAAIAKDPKFQKAVLELAELVHKQSEANKSSAGKLADKADASLRDTIETLRQNIVKSQDRQLQRVAEQPADKVQSAADNIRTLLIECHILEAQYKQITDQICAQAANVHSMEKFSGEADQLRSEIARLKAIVGEMGITLQKRKVELDAAPRVSIMQQASTPELGDSSRQYVVAGIGTLLGVFLVLIGAAVVWLLSRKRRASRDLSAGTTGQATEIRSSRGMKWIVTICCALLAGAVLGGLSWFLFPPKYESAAFVRVSRYEPAIWEQRSGTDFETYKQTMVEMIKSPPVLERAIEDKAIQEIPLYQKNSADPVNWLADALQVTEGNSELIRIALRSDNETGIKEIVDGVLAAFKSRIIDDEHDKKQSDYDNLERKFKAYESNVLEKERQLYNLSQQIGTADAPSAKVQFRMQTDELDTLLRLRTDIQRRMSDIRFKYSLATVLKDLEKEKGPPEADGDIQIAMQRNAQILELSKLLRQLKDTDKSSGAKSPDPAAAQISSEIAKARERIEKISADDRQAIESMKKK